MAQVGEVVALGNRVRHLLNGIAESLGFVALDGRREQVRVARNGEPLRLLIEERREIELMRSLLLLRIMVELMFFVLLEFERMVIGFFDGI